MEPIELSRWEPSPEDPRRKQYAGQRTAQEVFEELRHRLEGMGYLPDEYFLMNRDWENGREIPRGADIFCTTDYGGSEGIYLDVSLQWFTSQEVRNIADVAAMVTKALDAAGGEGETSVQALADHGGISLRPISADRFSAQVRDLFCEPPGKLLAELDLKDDTFYCASWVPREEHCVAVSGMISRLLGVYELAMVERLEKHLDLDRFCNEIWDHLHVSFVAPRMERQSERWGPRDRPETGRGALYKRAADLVATYEELLLVPDEACVTHYLGDLGIHIFKYDAAQEQIQNAYEKALSVMEMDDAEFQAEKQFVYRGEIISAMRDRLLVGELKPGETVLFVGTEPYGGPGDFELRGGVVEAVNPSERTCSVRGEFFTMHDVPLHYVLGRYDTSVEGEHYGFPHVRPLFGENRDLAGQYLREAEATCGSPLSPCAGRTRRDWATMTRDNGRTSLPAMPWRWPRL